MSFPEDDVPNLEEHYDLNWPNLAIFSNVIPVLSPRNFPTCLKVPTRCCVHVKSAAGFHTDDPSSNIKGR